MHRKLLKVVLVFGMVFSCSIGGNSVFADGAIIPGNNPTNGGCRPSNLSYWTDWWDTCYGASWQKYEVLKDLPEGGVRFYYTSNTGTPIAIRGCKKGQYVYNYGLEVYNGGGSTGYQVSTQRDKNLPQAPHNSAAMGGYGGTVSEYLRPMGYASAVEAKSSYEKMVKYVKAHPEFSYVGSLAFTWDTVGAFCYSDEADGSTFEGKSVASGTNTVTVGYTDKASFSFTTIDNCSATDGCKASFSHSLKRTSGDGSTDYVISRSSNLIEAGFTNGKAILSNSNLKTGTFNSNEAEVNRSGELTLYPGMVVCEKLEFAPNDQEGTSNVYTMACARALGSTQTSLGIKVKNNTTEKYNNYTEMIYGKPGDLVTYRAEYTPLAQYTRRVRPEKLQIINGGSVLGTFDNGRPCATVVPNSILLGYCWSETLYNGKKSNALNDWNNGFTVSSDELSYFKDYMYEDNDTQEKKENNDYSVLKTDVGKKLVEAVETNNAGSKVKTVPKGVSFTSGSDDKYNLSSVSVVAKIDVSNINKIAQVLVPYNFINTTEILTTNNIMYAGEKADVNYNITTSLKYNELLNETYATRVDGAKWKVEACYGENYENCYSKDGVGGDLHTDADILEETVKDDMSTKTQINIPDLPAGTKIRIRSAVYPKDSGSDDNLAKDYYDSGNAASWAYSEWKEFTIAKKPSFQVWGGSIYSAGDLELLASEKQHVDGYNNFNDILNNGGPFYVFGSWAELGLVANGKVSGFSSGAGTGFSSTEDARLAWGGSGVSGLGGSEENPLNYCARNALSFANMNCSKNVVGEIDGGNTRSDDKSVLISRFADEIKVIEGDTWNGPAETETGTNVYRSDGDLKITQDIKYTDGKNYSNLKEIPKNIIYTKGDILISCKVKRIDAVLIADGNINDCYDSDKINAKDNSTRLKINGSVIADTLTLKRTYGAAMGYNTVIPAEIINYDTSLYLWANGESDVVKSGKIVTAYQQELSPRY